MQPVVTFLVYCASEGQYLRQCVASILAQSFIDFEVLIYDDASDPDTAREIHLMSQEDGRVRYVRHEESVGPLTCFNQGVAQSQGELLWLISAADALASPQVLQDHVTQFVITPKLGLVFGRVQCIDGNGVPYEKYIPHKKNSNLPYQPTFYPPASLYSELLKENIIPECGVLLRKSALERAGALDVELDKAAFWHRYALISLDWKIYFDPSPKVYKRVAMSRVGQPESAAIDGASRLLHYEKLEHFLKAHGYPKPLSRRTQLFRLQLKRKLRLPMSMPERLIRLYRFLTR